MLPQFSKHKSKNPTLKQSERAKKLGLSSSTLQRYENDIKIISPYRNPPISHKRKQQISNRDFERPQMT